MLQNNVPFKYWYEYVSKIVRRTVCISYCLDVLGDVLLNYHCRQSIHLNTWKVFVRSERYKNMFEKYCPNGNSNVVTIGHPKMDTIFNMHSLTLNHDIEEVIRGRKVIL